MNVSAIPVPHVLKTAAWITRLAYAIALIGIIGSYGTQCALLLEHEVGPFSYVLPSTIDLLAVCAALALQLPGLDGGARKIAGWILTVAVTVSVAANVTGGHNTVARLAHAWPVLAYLFGELLANRVRSYAARLAGQHTPKPPAAAPTSPGMPPVEVEPAEVLAYRQAAAELRRTSRLPALNGKSG